MTKTNNAFVKIFSSVAGSVKSFALTQFSISLLLVLTPLLITPSFADIYNPVKQTLLIVLVTLALFGWSLQLFKAREWNRKKGLLAWLPLFIWISVVISAVLSSSGYIAWVGTGAQGFTAVLPITAYMAVLMMVINGGEDAHRFRWYGASMMLGVLLASIYGLLEYLGVSFLAGTRGYVGFSLTGMFESLRILAVAMTLLATGIWITADRNRKDVWMPTVRWRTIFTVLGSLTVILTIALLVISDARQAQITLLVGSAVLVALGLFDPKKFTSPVRLLLPMFLFAMTIVLIVAPAPFAGKTPPEISPNTRVSTQIAIDTLKSDGIFGSGPGTWQYDYTRFRTEDINGSILWRMKFDHSISHILTLSATWGIVPTALLVLFFIVTLIKLSGALLLKRSRESWQTTVVVGTVWLSLLVSKFIYSSDPSQEIIFWVITGLLLSILIRPTKKVEFSQKPRTALVTSFMIVVASLGFIFSIMLSAQWMSAESAIARAAELQRNGAERPEVLNQVAKAVSLNRWDAGYNEALSIIYLRHIDDLAADVKANAEQIGKEANISVELASRAISLEPKNASAYNTLGEIYTSLSAVITGSDALALNQFRMSAKLDPKNPEAHNRLAKALTLSSDNAKQLIQDEEEKAKVLETLLTEAEDEINEAIRLKPDYRSLYYTRALILERQNKLEESIQNLIALVKVSPQDATLRFELGVIQLRAGHKDFAMQDFTAAVNIAPTFANARWFLVALYEDAGNTAAAIEQLEALQTLDPDNTTITDKLNLIKQGATPQVPPEQVEPLVEPVTEE